MYIAAIWLLESFRWQQCRLIIKAFALSDLGTWSPPVHLWRWLKTSLVNWESQIWLAPPYSWVQIPSAFVETKTKTAWPCVLQATNVGTSSSPPQVVVFCGFSLYLACTTLKYPAFATFELDLLSPHWFQLGDGGCLESIINFIVETPSCHCAMLYRIHHQLHCWNSIMPLYHAV